MKGSLVFARKELREILRTWRIWVLPGVVVFFALSGPFLARYTPEIVGAVAGGQLGNLVLPTPSYADAYAGWIKNLSQLILFAVIIINGGLISAERNSGTAVLVLTKPVSRGAFVAAKAIVHAGFLAVLLAVGTLITWALTAVLFGKAPGESLWASSLTWLILGILFIAIMTIFSVVIPAPAGAAGAGIGAYALLAIAAIWKPLADYSPAGLMDKSASLAVHTATTSVFWPIVVSLLLSVSLVWLAAALLRRADL